MITIKTKKEIQKMRDAGKILAEVHQVVKDNFKIGISAATLDKLVYDTILKNNAKPSFLGYRGFKHSTCISRNEEVVHGIPYPDKLFLPGDICSIDIGVYFNGYHADAARTLCCDPVDDEVKKLVEVTEQSFFEGVKHAKTGGFLGDISHGIQLYAEAHGFSVVRDLYSHGIGSELHEEPLIPNYGKPGSGVQLKEGMTFAIEPMINIGTYDVLTLEDKWTIITADQKWSAHYENTICVTDSGPEILTLS